MQGRKVTFDLKFKNTNVPTGHGHPNAKGKWQSMIDSNTLSEELRLNPKSV